MQAEHFHERVLLATQTTQALCHSLIPRHATSPIRGRLAKRSRNRLVAPDVTPAPPAGTSSRCPGDGAIEDQRSGPMVGWCAPVADETSSCAQGLRDVAGNGEGAVVGDLASQVCPHRASPCAPPVAECVVLGQVVAPVGVDQRVEERPAVRLPIRVVPTAGVLGDQVRFGQAQECLAPREQHGATNEPGRDKAIHRRH